MNATPENFKPGERWLVWRQSYQALREPPLEMTCIEWAQSGKFVKVMYGISKVIEWLKDRPFLGERLPDVESGNHKTESEGRLEAPCGKCDCCRWEIEQHRNEITKEEKARLGRIVEKNKDEIEPGRTFSVVPPEYVETKA